MPVVSEAFSPQMFVRGQVKALCLLEIELLVPDAGQAPAQELMGLEALLIERGQQRIELALVLFHEGKRAALQDPWPALRCHLPAAEDGYFVQTTGQVRGQLFVVQEQHV